MAITSNGDVWQRGAVLNIRLRSRAAVAVKGRRAGLR
jgi:hypothetical protein